MAVQKNFVIKNGLEVNENLIFADNNSGKVGIGTTIVRATLEVKGNVLVENVTLTGVVTFSNPLNVNKLNAVAGVVTSLTGTAVTYTSTNFGTSNITRLNALSGVVTSLTGTAVTYSTADFGIVGVSTLNAVSGVVTTLTGTTANIGTVNVNNLYAVTGVVTTLTGTTSNFDIQNTNNLNALSGVVTSLTGTAVTYSTADFGIVGVSTLNAVSGVVTDISGSTLNYTGSSTIGNLTVSQDIDVVGVVTASFLYGDGSNITNLPTAPQTYWTQNITGIHTLGNVGIGTTTVDGAADPNNSYILNVGIVTANFLYGDGSNLTGIDATAIQNGTTSVQTNANNIVNTVSGVGIATITESGVNITGIVTSNSALIGSDVTINSTGIVATTGIITATDFNSTSDFNLKENITTVDGALNIANQLRGVKFEWKKDHKPSYGVIAQELEEVLPELVSDTDPKTVNYNGIIGVLIEAVKELSARVKELEDK